MAQSAKDIRINELLDANSQLNTTVKHLVDALTQKDKALADMQTRLDEMTEELKLNILKFRAIQNPRRQNLH